jgi:hypothetical protein
VLDGNTLLIGNRFWCDLVAKEDQKEVESGINEMDYCGFLETVNHGNLSRYSIRKKV